jgi:hypothetical protein
VTEVPCNGLDDDCNPSTPDGAQCGNGTMECGELCDDGAANGTGEGLCLSTCLGVQTCGDGDQEGSEACDDGFTDACGTCNADCTGPGVNAPCGDNLACPESEICDGSDLGGLDCTDFGWQGGAGLGCTGCVPDVSGCTGPCQVGQDPDYDGLCNGGDTDDDDDGCLDGVDPALTPYPSLSILYVAVDTDTSSNNGWQQTAADVETVLLLTRAGHVVTWLGCSTGSDSQVAWDGALSAGIDVVFVSESCSSGDLTDGTNAWFNSYDVGVVTNEPAVYDDMQISPAVDQACAGSATVVDAAHYITVRRGLGTMTLFQAVPTTSTVGGACVGKSTGATQAAGLRSLMTGATATDHILWTVDTGGALLTGTATNRRAGFGPSWVESGTNAWTPALISTFLRTLVWAAGRDLDDDSDGDLIGDDCD